ncbi:hypothetical protein UYO_0748 [Lachnospiraceae bacterium JC7]|nr:hypothetical protein UYO_0748 [Lachnospiraceae bacterium JC7]
MKRIITVVMLLLSISCSLTAYAKPEKVKGEQGASADNPVILWLADYDEPLYDGKWTETDFGIDIYLPNTWEVQEKTDEKLKLRGSKDGLVIITRKKIPENAAGKVDNESLVKSVLKKQDIKITYVESNGLPAILYDLEENGITITQCSRVTEDDYFLFVNFCNLNTKLSESEVEEKKHQIFSSICETGAKHKF